MQLATIQNSALALPLQVTLALEKLDADDRSLIVSGLSTKIFKLPEIDCKESLVDIIAYAHMISGQPADRTKLALHATETYRRLMIEFPACTLDEVKAAITNGIYDQYGEYYGLNAKFFMMFIREYMTAEKRKYAMLKFNALQMSKLTVEGKILTVKAYQEWILEDYRRFLNDEIGLILFSKRKYFLLRQLGYIEFTKKEKWFNWLAKAKNKREWHISTEKDKSLRTALMKVYSRFEETSELPVKEYDIIVYQARRMIYLKFFEIMREFGIKNFFEEINTTPFIFNDSNARNNNSEISKKNYSLAFEKSYGGFQRIYQAS